MRYHWGLGIGHTYSHSQDAYPQQYSMASNSPNEADSTEEEDPSDAPNQTSNVSGGAGAEKPDEDNDQLQDSEVATQALDISGGPGAEKPNEGRLQDLAPEDADDEDVDSAGSSDAGTSDDGSAYGSDAEDEERLELYHMYHGKL